MGQSGSLSRLPQCVPVSTTGWATLVEWLPQDPFATTLSTGSQPPPVDLMRVMSSLLVLAIVVLRVGTGSRAQAMLIMGVLVP